MLKLLSAVLGLLVFTASLTSFASSSPELYDPPRAASLADDVVNVRAGPGEQYPILWIFERKGWPVKLVARFDNWFKIRDIDGEEGWIFRSLISSTNTAIISPGEPTPLFRNAEGTRTTHLVGPDVVVALADECTTALCQVQIGNVKGWLNPGRLQQPR